MKKVLLIGAGFIAGASVVLLVWNPSPVLHRVSAVYLVWFIAGAINNLLLIAMAGMCMVTVRQLTGRDLSIRGSVWSGMNNRWFWPAFWISAAAWLVTTLAPLGLVAVVPVWTALGVFAANLAVGNWLGVPLRIWIWRIHSQDEVPV